jgi:hypothetical protein
MLPSRPHLLDRIPSPESVRRQLSANLREGRLLRRLLAVAETAWALKRQDTDETPSGVVTEEATRS